MAGGGARLGKRLPGAQLTSWRLGVPAGTAGRFQRPFQGPVGRGPHLLFGGGIIDDVLLLTAIRTPSTITTQRRLPRDFPGHEDTPAGTIRIILNALRLPYARGIFAGYGRYLCQTQARAAPQPILLNDTRGGGKGRHGPGGWNNGILLGRWR